MTGHSPLVQWIEALFPSIQSQVVGTVLTLVLLLLAGEVVRRVGGPLKDRYDDALVESLQAGLMSTLTALVGAFLVVVWRAIPQVEEVLQILNFTRTDVVKVVFTIAILAASYTLTRITKHAIRRLFQARGAISQHQKEIAHHVVQVTIYSLSFIVVLSLWNVDVGNLLIGAGFLGIVLGLAARQTLGAVLAGFVVLFSRPFELGDWVVIGDQEGVVTDISVYNTRIRTFDDEFVMIPNDKVTSTDVVNRSRKGRLRLNQDMGVDYESDVRQAIECAEAVMRELDIVEEKPEPEVVLPEFGDSAIILRLRYYISNPSSRKMWEARTQVIANVNAAFHEAGIKIPFPQRELMGREETGGLQLSGETPTPAADAIAGDVGSEADGSVAGDGEADEVVAGGGEADEDVGAGEAQEDVAGEREADEDGGAADSGEADPDDSGHADGDSDHGDNDTDHAEGDSDPGEDAAAGAEEVDVAGIAREVVHGDSEDGDGDGDAASGTEDDNSGDEPATGGSAPGDRPGGDG